MTSEFFRVADGLELVGGNNHFGRRGRANASDRCNPSEDFFQTIIALNQFSDLFLSCLEVSVDRFEQRLTSLGKLFLESDIYESILFGDGLLKLFTY